MAWLPRILNAWQRHGPLGFVRLAARNIAHYSVPGRGGAERSDSLDELDKHYGTETSGIREVGTLDVDSKEARHATRYQPSGASAVRREIQDLRIDPTEFSFVDYGSGKGRVLLIAAEFAFREIVGIEFSRELHDIAMANIARLPASMTVGGRVRSVHADAADAKLPEGNLVCYFYNPFGAPVLKRVVERLAAHRKAGHRIMVIYVEPRHRKPFGDSGIFTVRKDTNQVLVLDTRGGTNPG
jgi:SAM-dependent methyltransferase